MAAAYAYLILMPTTLLLASMKSVNLNHIVSADLLFSCCVTECLQLSADVLLLYKTSLCFTFHTCSICRQCVMCLNAGMYKTDTD